VKYNAIQTVARSMQTEPASPELLSGQEPPIQSLDRPAVTLSSSLPFLIIGALLAALYYRIAIKLVIDWYNIADYSHGFLVPLFSLFLLWDKRKQIATTPVRPTWAGLGLVVFGLITLVFGVYGVDLFTSRLSFVILLAGLVWTFFGGQIIRQVLFPILVLLLAIPFPAIVFNQITFPLQLLASRLASMILPLLGVPVLQEGNVIQLPVMKLEVAEACSGIRSLMSLFTLAVFYGYFLERGTKRRVILALASIPIAVAANVARIVGTGLCVQYWDPVKALGFFHEFSGWVMFVISLICLYMIHRLMQLVAPSKEKAI
jgi:exosortase